MKLLNPEDKNKFVTYVKEHEPTKYLFNVITGEISEDDAELFNDFNNNWFYLYEDYYPVYENGTYIGCFWNGEFKTCEDLQEDLL